MCGWVPGILNAGAFTLTFACVLQVSEFAEENDLREIFERFGRVTRVFLAKDRDTGRAKGFAFISFQERSDAAKACEKIDGCKCHSLQRFRKQQDNSEGLHSLTLLYRWLWALDSSGGVCKAGYLELRVDVYRR